MEHVETFVCPDCRLPLIDLHCSACAHQYVTRSGFPVLLSRNPKYQEASDYGAAYDAIYDDRTNAWEDQGRTPEFLEYFASLLNTYGRGRYLEIGCGEGFLLQRVDAAEKHAVDLSTRALCSAKMRTGAHLSVSLAERLPYPDNSFDLIAAVGVMEHFIDADEAFEEIRRVLKPGGHFVNLVHVDLTKRERVTYKLKQYWFPRPRPIEFAKWLQSRLAPAQDRGFPKQPIQNRYTTRGGMSLMAAAGFVVCQTLNTRNDPDLPLAGPDVVIYVAKK